ncbi:MAG: chemoreceptor glutamine deamidase CheD [Gammaproteobacteria bacterium]
MLLAAAKELPQPLPGFEAINHYWDPHNQMPAAKILPGEYYVTRNNEIITTVLGSCVSACMHDMVAGVGGMNHFMLPVSNGQGWSGKGDLVSTANRYGNFAMEHMINEILKNGGRKRNIEVKIFGGGSIISTMTHIGELNIKFVRMYLENEGLRLVGEDVGDIYPRKVVYFPATGRVMVKKLKQLRNNVILERENQYRSDIERKPLSGEIELFD